MDTHTDLSLTSAEEIYETVVGGERCQQTPVSVHRESEDVTAGVTSCAGADAPVTFEQAVDAFRVSVEPGLTAAKEAFENALSKRKADQNHFLVVGYRAWVAAQHDREGFERLAKQHDVSFTAHKRRPFNEVLQVLHRAAGLPSLLSPFASRHGKRLDRMHVLLEQQTGGTEGLPAQVRNDQIVDALRTVLREESIANKERQSIKAKSAGETVASPRVEVASPSEAVDVDQSQIDVEAVQVSPDVAGSTEDLPPVTTGEADRALPGMKIAQPSLVNTETDLEPTGAHTITNADPSAIIAELRIAIEGMFIPRAALDAVAALMERVPSDYEEAARIREVVDRIPRVNRFLRQLQKDLGT